MKKESYSCSAVARRLWLYTAACLTLGAGLYQVIVNDFFTAEILFVIPLFIAATIGSLPALFILFHSLKKINKPPASVDRKLSLLFATCLFISFLYGFSSFLLSQLFYSSDNNGISFCAAVTCILFLASLVATLINYQPLVSYFSSHFSSTDNQLNKTNMEQDNSSATEAGTQFQSSNSYRDAKPLNRTFIKAGITAVLILLMLIPVGYIQSLISDRKELQEQVIDEVSSKWAAPQTVTPLYLAIPYKTGDTTGNKKEVIKEFVVLPEQLEVKGNIEPQQKHRSNYDVLLYRSQLNINGAFRLQLPQNLKPEQLLLSEAKVCTGISDFKGIEKRVVVHLGNSDFILSPGLPVDIDSNGLSAPVTLISAQLAAPVAFSFSLQLKGSRQLHFKPMSGNSSYELTSTWPHPSFDGNVIPVKDENDETEGSFPAKWNFSNANLPFTTTLQDDAIKNYNDLAFGVSLIQPVDQYVQSMRSIKYAILVIGLTFALFFIVEMVQKNPVHPVQYVLVGLALVIFYSLLISISEFIPFDWSYLIAATATVLLITLYTKSHFKSWKTAGIFLSVLASLYGFIYVLISLEDTALLAGSIALFIVLAIAMYASRKINWYGDALPEANIRFSSTI